MSRMKVKNRSRVRKKSSMCKESRRKTWYLREDMRKSITVRTKVRRVVAGREINGVLDDLQIIAWHETRVATAVGDFGLPPPVILQADNRKDIALAKAELFGDGGIVGVHGTSEMQDWSSITAKFASRLCNSHSTAPGSANRRTVTISR